MRYTAEVRWTKDNGKKMEVFADSEKSAQDAQDRAILEAMTKGWTEPKWWQWWRSSDMPRRAYLSDNWKAITDELLFVGQDPITAAGKTLTAACWGGSEISGWHNDPKTGKPRTSEENKALFPTRIALCHSELSEALEGDRKDIQDDHLPHRKMAEVELADAAIRIFDLGGVMKFDLGAAIAEKLAYNAKRLDHKVAVRNMAGGKAY